MVNENQLSTRVFKFLNVTHRTALRVTGGRWPHTLFGMPGVELHTIGRTSGQRRSTFLTSPVHDENRVVLVASKGGDPRDPRVVPEPDRASGRGGHHERRDQTDEGQDGLAGGEGGVVARDPGCLQALRQLPEEVRPGHPGRDLRAPTRLTQHLARAHRASPAEPLRKEGGTMRPMSMEPAGSPGEVEGVGGGTGPSEGGGDAAFDLSMAVSQLSSNGTDLRIMLKLLVSQLSDVWGIASRWSGGGRFRKSDEIKAVRIGLGDDTLEAVVEGASVRCSIGHSSGGIRIRSEQVGMDVWLTRLLATLQSEAATVSRRSRPGEHLDRRPIVTEQTAQSEPQPPQSATGGGAHDLPKEAGHRLEELEHGLFTSDLSVNEFLLIKEAGFHPLGFVMGSSIYHTGIQARRWSKSQELTKLTEAMYNGARAGHDPDGGRSRRAGRRRRGGRAPRRELLRVGPRRGGVHRRGHGREGRGRHVAPQRASASPSPRTSRARTSGRFMQTGYVPQGLVMGTCVFHIAHRGLGQALGTVGQNVELPNFTQALYEARELAMTRMQDEANTARGHRHRRCPPRGEVAPVGLAHHRIPVTRHRRHQVGGDVTLPKPITVISLDN